MPRPVTLKVFSLPAIVVGLVFAGGAAGAQTPMKSTAPQKMMPPDEAKKLQACQKQAAQLNIAMNERSKFVMDCMTAKAK